MSGGERLAVGTCLLAVALAVAAAAPARKGTAAASAPATASARASAPAAAASAPTEFSGSLVAGETYVADVFFDSRALHIWRPVKEVFPGKDVAWTIAWTNLDQFPALKTTATQARPQRMRFRVAKTDMLSGSPKLPWMATYRCEILAVEPLPAAAPTPHAARKR
ncbi:MAG TPA: hypothetical protein VGH48_10065 [Caldimonas sp.]|jgi:hypothetical protein